MVEGKQGGDPGVDEPVDEPISGDATETGAASPEESFDFKREVGSALDTAAEQMEGTHEALQLKELAEWRDTEFKDSMYQVVEAQQDVCGQEGNTEACANGREIFKQMFGEPWAAAESEAGPDAEATPAS